MMALKAPRAGERIEVLKPVFGKGMIDQTFFYPQPDGTEKPETFRLWHYTKGWTASIMGVTKDGKVIVNREFRHGANDFVYALPGGAPKGVDPTPEGVAAMEFGEESGYKSGRIISLGYYWPAAASNTEKVYTFLALDCEPGPAVERESTEVIETNLIPIEDWYKMIAQGKVTCGISLAISILALPHLPNSPYQW